MSAHETVTSVKKKSKKEIIYYSVQKLQSGFHISEHIRRFYQSSVFNHNLFFLILPSFFGEDMDGTLVLCSQGYFHKAVVFFQSQSSILAGFPYHPHHLPSL